MDGILTLAVPVDDQIERVARLADQRDKLLAGAIGVGCMVVIYQRQIALRRQRAGVLVRDRDGIFFVRAGRQDGRLHFFGIAAIGESRCGHTDAQNSGQQQSADLTHHLHRWNPPYY